MTHALLLTDLAACGLLRVCLRSVHAVPVVLAISASGVTLSVYLISFQVLGLPAACLTTSLLCRVIRISDIVSCSTHVQSSLPRLNQQR